MQLCIVQTMDTVIRSLKYLYTFKYSHFHFRGNLRSNLLTSVMYFSPIYHILTQHRGELATFIESQAQVLILLCIIVPHQYQNLVGPDLGLGVNVGDPEIDEEVFSTLKRTSNEQILREVLFLVIFNVREVLVAMGWLRAWCALPPTKVAMCNDQCFDEKLVCGVGQVGVFPQFPPHFSWREWIIPPTFHIIFLWGCLFFLQAYQVSGRSPGMRAYLMSRLSHPS